MKIPLHLLPKTITFILLMFCFSHLALAQQTRYVTPSGAGAKTGADWANAADNLQAMINAVGTSSVFVAVGTYIAPSNGFTMKNNVAIYGGFNPSAGITELSHARILPTATGGGSILSGNDVNRVIYNDFTDASPLTGTAILDGFTLTKGNSNYGGGGMYNYYASPTVNNCAIIGNNTSSTGDANGGGVYNSYSSPVFTNVAIANNTVTSSSSRAYGGGVYNSFSNPVFTRVLITGNTATTNDLAFGGGVYNWYSRPVFTHVTIANNTTRSTTRNAFGGGVYNSYSNPLFTYVVITNNTATSIIGNTYGGGVYNSRNPSPVFNNTTITGNVAQIGEAIHNLTSSNTKIVNSIVLGESTGLNPTNLSYSLVQGINNTTNNNINATGITPTTVFTNVASPAGADGIFGTADDGLALKTGSPALDKGNNAEVTTNIDLAGLPRVRNGNVDLGAYEYQDGNTTTLVYVKEGSSGTGDNWDDALGNLDAVSAPDNGDTKRVFVAVGTYIAPSGGFKMNNNVAIYGGFNPAGGITNLTHARILPTATGGGSVLSGNNVNRVINNNFTAVSPLTGTAILDGFTITKGNSNYGGGMYNNYASPNVSNCAIIDNIAATTNTVDAVGGGVSNAFSSPVFTNVLIAGNKASAATASYAVGGGVYNRDASNPVFTNVLITGNEVDASTKQGGGIYNRDGSNPAFTNVTIAGNIAGVGSEMYNHTSGTYSLNIKNSIVIGAGASGVSNLDPTNVSYSLVQGINNTTNNNVNATNVTPAMVFFNAASPAGTDGIFGTTDDGLALSNTSPALNKGDKTLYIDLTANTKDLAGNPRVYDFDNGGQIDLGAYEFQGMPLVLPVQFGSFTVAKQNNSAKLQWNTLSESNNKEFIISRSSDGVTFTELARINGNGTVNSPQNYLYLDSNPLNGINYYRLQQIDTDGKVEVLGVKTLNFSLSSLSLAAYPNPTHNLVNLDFTVGRFNQLQVADLSGRILQTLSLKPTDRNAIVDLGSSPIGIYVLSLTGANGTENIKVIKR